MKKHIDNLLLFMKSTNSKFKVRKSQFNNSIPIKLCSQKLNAVIFFVKNYNYGTYLDRQNEKRNPKTPLISKLAFNFNRILRPL